MSKIIYKNGDVADGITSVNRNVSLLTVYGGIDNNSGFVLIADSNPTMPVKYEDFTTVYKIEDDCVIYSNDGEVWVEPTRDIVVSVNWVNVDESIIPEEVEVIVNEDETVILSDENEWKKVYPDIPVSVEDYTVSAEPIEYTEMSISGTTITYEVPVYTPDTQEQIDALYDVVCELDDRVYALEETEGE